MPSFQGRTPEALLGRNDSKNAATTCRGITASGRPCRRALATSSLGKRSGVVAVVEEDDKVKDAEFYCYQHKDQAEQKAAEPVPVVNTGRRKTQLYPLKERSSIDTLVQKLGVEGVGSDISAAVRPKRKDRPSRPPRSDTIPEQGQAPYAEKYDFNTPAQRRPKQKKSSFWSLLCCVFDNDDDDYVEVVRHRKRVDGSRPQEPGSRPPASNTPRPPSGASRPASTSAPGTRPSPILPLRPLPHHTPSSKSQTGQLLSLMPQHLSPQTTSSLLAELSKPPNPNDEQGYIYIFWLTPQSAPSPPESTARSLLVPESSGRPRNDRRISDVLTEFSFNGSSERDIHGASSGKKTILLKIGRANNVHRRMTEWQRQCGYALTLVRFYPYVSSSAPPSPAPSPRPPNRQRPQPQLYPDLSATASASRPSTSRRESGVVRKVPCVKRVERLIHLELSERQAKQRCDVCGREHKEWFEVDASEKGVKAVDEVVKRWVDWGEQQVL